MYPLLEQPPTTHTHAHQTSPTKPRPTTSPTRAALSGAYAVDLSHVLRTLYNPSRCAILVVIRHSLSASDLLTEGFSIANTPRPLKKQMLRLSSVFSHNVLYNTIHYCRVIQ